MRRANILSRIVWDLHRLPQTGSFRVHFSEKANFYQIQEQTYRLKIMVIGIFDEVYVIHTWVFVSKK
jgi:hypothetical protein